MVDINEYKKDFKMYCEKANGFVKEQKSEEAIKFYKKAAKSWENLIKFDENNNHPAYEQKKTEIKKIEEIES